MSKENFDNLLFLDTETTGVDENDRLFQVAYKMGGQEKNALFRPPVKISIEAMEVSQVTNREVEDKEPFDGSKMKQELTDILSNSDTILVAHNARFDIQMLEREGLEVKSFIDTLKVAQHLDTEAKIPAYRLQYLRYFLDLEVKDAPAHDALGDVLVLEALFERLYEKMIGQGLSHQETMVEMMRISKEPMLIKRINFGKHKGRLIRDIAETDADYLEWLLKEKEKEAVQGKADEDWLYTLKHYLK